MMDTPAAKKRSRVGQKQYKEAKTPEFHVYLGTATVKATRITQLEGIAAKCGAANIAQLVQRIADGDLIVIPPR